ncbi:hypothetical protein SB778_44880, partial [Paraburkholderia sp. SIMBA_050]
AQLGADRFDARQHGTAERESGSDDGVYRNRIVENLHENASASGMPLWVNGRGELGFSLSNALLVLGMAVASRIMCIACV